MVSQPEHDLAWAREMLEKSKATGRAMTVVLDEEKRPIYQTTTEPPVFLGYVFSPEADVSWEEMLEQACARHDELLDEASKLVYPPTRVGLAQLDYEALHKLLDVPEGHRIDRFWVDEARNTVMLRVVGPSMPRVNPGCEIPIVAGKWEFTTVELPPEGEDEITELRTYGRLDWWPEMRSP